LIELPNFYKVKISLVSFLSSGKEVSPVNAVDQYKVGRKDGRKEVINFFGLEMFCMSPSVVKLDFCLVLGRQT
jgi:hypothetical protein